MNDFYNRLSKYKDKIMMVAMNGCTLIACAVISTGFDFSLATFTRWDYWLKTLTDYLLLMAIFNTTFNDTIRTAKILTTGDYYDSKIRVQRYVKIVRDNHLEKYLEEKAEEINKQRHDNAIWQRLNKHTTGLAINEDGTLDYSPFESLDEFFEIKHINKRRKAKILKDITAALNGDIKYLEIHAYQVLGHEVNDSDDDRCEEVTMNKAKADIRLNAKKTIIFLMSSALINAISWGSINYKSVWILLVAHAALIFSNILSAIKCGYDRINLLTSLNTNKASFLNSAIGEWEANKYKECMETETPTDI